MRKEDIQKIIDDIGHIRISASKEEKYTAEYLRDAALKLGAEKAYVEPFEVPVTTIHKAVLSADGKEIPCKGYELCGSGKIEAPFVYISSFDKANLAKVNGKIVLFDGLVSTFNYHDMLDAGAVGFITYDGDVKWADNDIDLRELRDYMAQGRKVLGVNINAKDAAKLCKNPPKTISIEIDQTEAKGNSYITVAEIPGTTDEWINISAHMDSRPTAPGVWDNLSGCIAVLTILEAAAKKAPHKYGVRASFVGSEERGLLGSKAYVKMHEADMKKTVFEVNTDMVGAIMGQIICCVNADHSAINYVQQFANKVGFSVNVVPKVIATDSSAFADAGVPAITFGQMSPSSQAVIHSRYDDGSTVCTRDMKYHCDFIADLTVSLLDAVVFPIPREIPEDIKDQLDKYFFRKR
jgi:Zn-dependent M28 family amino/carboxypeptidase